MGWGVMQVGELLFEAFEVPEGAYTLLVILVLLGFPVAVVLAWAYEITPQGVRRDVVRELRREQEPGAQTGCPRLNGVRALFLLSQLKVQMSPVD